jgi:hypothetical protein
MFEFLMLIGFLGAGFCHLLPPAEGKSAGRDKGPAKEGKGLERASHDARRIDGRTSKEKRPANVRRTAGQGPVSRAA